MVVCWPTLTLFVACCPLPETVYPEEVRCPAPFDGAERCCTPAVLGQVLRQFGSLSQEETLHIMPEDTDYRHTLRTVGEQLFQYVRDINVLDLDAWRLHALATARNAIAETDVVKDLAVQRGTPETARQLWRTALSASRALARSIFRIENFQQFLLGYTAHAQQELLQGFDPEKVREAFSPEVLEVYTSALASHDLLAFNLIPQAERFFTPERPFSNETSVVNLMVVSLGEWAKTGFTTIWTALQRTSRQLRVFVLGDVAGHLAWKEAIAELMEDPRGQALLARSRYEYIDFIAEPRFQALLERYPKDCSFGDAGMAILARVVCHEVLPLDVDRVITMDLGDILVLDDLAGLWDIGDQFEEHHLLAASHAVALHHVNGGLVLYNVKRMRERGWSDHALRAARDALLRESEADGVEKACPRDQSIINVLHSFREKYSYEGPSPVMLLPCRWSLFPVAEWQPHWNSPAAWLPEIRERRRFPGIVSLSRVEIYCPDVADMLSAWAWIPMTETPGDTRQSRLRLWAHHDGSKKVRYCSAERPKQHSCCRCGEAAAIVHIAGDLKSWPSMRNFIQAHAPPFRRPPAEDALMRASSLKWWGGSTRTENMLLNSEKQAYLVAKVLGLNAQFPNCVTMHTKPRGGVGKLVYHGLQLRPRLPIDIWVETTAPEDAHMLIGIGGHSGLEFVVGAEGGTTSLLRYVRSSPGWAARGNLLRIPHAVQTLQARWAELGSPEAAALGSPEAAKAAAQAQQAAVEAKAAAVAMSGEAGRDTSTQSGASKWFTFRLRIFADQNVEIDFRGLSWSTWLPEEAFWMLRHDPLSLSIATLQGPANWGVCLGALPR